MSQLTCKLSNFTLSKLTFTVQPVNKKASKIEYVLNLAESIDIKADKEELIIKVEKLNEQTSCYYFKTKLSHKIAFIEDYCNKEVFLQDLSNFKKIKKLEKNEITVEIQNLDWELNKSENKMSQLNEEINGNKEIDQSKLNNEAVPDTFNMNENSDNLLICQAGNLNRSNQTNHAINQNKKDEGVLNNDANPLLVKKDQLEEKELNEDIFEKQLLLLDAKNKGETHVKISSSWNHFIDYVKSNVVKLNPGNQSHEDIINNKEKLLNEIMNETIYEEIFFEENASKVQSPRINQNENSKANEFVADNNNKTEKIASNLNNEPKIEKNKDLVLNNNFNNKLFGKDEIFLSQISEKLGEQFDLGSGILKDLNTQYATLCLNAANKSNENEVNLIEVPLFKEASDPDILAQQNKIDELIKQAMKDNQKLKSEYMCESFNPPKEFFIQENFSYDKNLNSFLEGADNRKVSENTVNRPEANLDYKELSKVKADAKLDNLNNQNDLVHNSEGENAKVVNLLSNLPKESHQTKDKDNIAIEQDKSDIIVDRSKFIDLTVKKCIDKNNGVIDLNHNIHQTNNNNNDLNCKSRATQGNLIWGQNNIVQSPINNNNDYNEIAEKQPQTKYQPIDVESFLKTLFSFNNK